MSRTALTWTLTADFVCWKETERGEEVTEKRDDTFYGRENGSNDMFISPNNDLVVK